MTPTTAIPTLLPASGDDSRGARRRPSVILLLCGYFVLFAFALTVTPRHGPSFAIVNDIAYLPFRATAALLLYQAARTSRDAEISKSWMLMFWGQLFAIVGNLGWLFTDLTGRGISDLIYIGGTAPYYALQLIGLLIMMRARHAARERANDWIDAAVIMIAGAVVAWYFLARQVAHAEIHDGTASALFFFTTASNFAVTFFALAVWLRRPPGVSRPAMARITVALALFTVADIVFEQVEFSGNYVSGSWLDLLYAGAVVIFALGVDWQRRYPSGNGHEPTPRSGSDVIPLIAMGIALLPLLLEAVKADFRGNAVGGIMVGFVLLTVLVLVRQRFARTEIDGLISARIALEQQLWQAQKMEAVGRLAGGIAHDFNNILAAISLHAQLLRTAGIAHEGDDLEEIEFATQRAAALTRRLLAFSRSSTPDVHALSVADTVRSMEPMIRRLLISDITFTLEIHNEAAWVTLGDGQLEQILLNLAINSRDAMPSGGQLQIATRLVTISASDSFSLRGVPNGHWALLEVRDNGEGMDQATRARLFEPFFTTKPRDRGTGLGLATVNGIVMAAGGHILVDTEVGDGTMMTVLLPVADPVAAPRRSSDEPNHGSTVPAPPHGVATILVVDDELSLRRAVGRFFTRLGYEVIEAADGLSALAELERREWAVDLVLTDVEMPGINGLELANRIRRRAPTMLILYMSGFVDSRTASGDIAADDGIVLMKPFDFAVLVERVRDALATRAR